MIKPRWTVKDRGASVEVKSDDGQNGQVCYFFILLASSFVTFLYYLLLVFLKF